MRKGIKPPGTPKVGTFYRSRRPVGLDTQKEEQFDIVAVMGVKSGYARMGFRSDIVEYTPGLYYAVRDERMQYRWRRSIERDMFLEHYSLVEDVDELSEVLGMRALKYYA